MSERVLVTVAAGVLTATLNRPDKRNAIDSAMIDALLAVLDRADLDGEVRVVALRGAGADFCAGMDLGELLASADHPIDRNRDAALRFGAIFLEVQRGFVPAIVLTMLRRAVGEKIAFDLAATGRLLDATEAATVGLVSRVYEDTDFEEQVGDVLRALAAASPTALALTKQQFYQLEGLSFEEGIRLGADVNAVSRTTPDFRAALTAFLKK